jgi:hypothetical protein
MAPATVVGSTPVRKRQGRRRSTPDLACPGDEDRPPGHQSISRGRAASLCARGDASRFQWQGAGSSGPASRRNARATGSTTWARLREGCGHLAVASEPEPRPRCVWSPRRPSFPDAAHRARSTGSAPRGRALAAAARESRPWPRVSHRRQAAAGSPTRFVQRSCPGRRRTTTPTAPPRRWRADCA